MSIKGKYIVLEGPEGVGKTTQIQELALRLQKAGLPVRVLREPDSQSDITARAIRQLTQDPRYPMNTRTEVLLYNAARAQSLEVIRHSIEQGVNCIVDRNYLTTLAIQYYGRGDVPDYDTINSIIKFAVGDMEPDLCVIMDAPVQVLRERAKYRGSGERFDNLDEAFLERVRAGYLWEAKQRGYPVVFATETPEIVSGEIWKLVAATLGRRDSKAAAATKGPASIKEIINQREPAPEASAESAEPESIPPEGATVATPMVEKDAKGHYHVTEAGMQYLEGVVTNTTGDVYGFYDKMSPITIAAAMARLSRRGDDMRITILDEFVGKAEKDEQLLHRVITAYGDDSVQQLGGQHFVVENASNLAVKKVEWGRLAAYLEQSTRYIYFDEKGADGRYKYHIPAEFKGKLRDYYVSTTDQIFDLYSEMVKDLTEYVRKHSTTPEKERDGAWRNATKAQACDAVRAVLPVSYTGTVGIYASGQAIESLIMHLLSDELHEARELGQKLLKEARKVIPVFLERADKPERGGATVAYRANMHAKVQELAKDLLPASHTAVSQPVTLVDYTLRNELDIVPDMLYEHSDLPLEQLQEEVGKWDYQKKVKVFQAYMGERLNRRHRPGRALEKIHYSFDIVSDYGVFKALQRHRMVDDMNWQEISPRLGYDVPKLVEEAGLTEQFEQCFALSLELYSRIQAEHGQLLAQYAVLQGNNVRWKVTINAREAFQMLELRTGPQGHPTYRKIAQQMYQKIAEIHPLLAEAMIFINKDEDPELTRLAAERYTQFKLSQLQ